MPSPQFSNLTQIAIEAALKAGEILKKGFGTNFKVSLKPGIQNYVTEYDKLSEEEIISLIKETFPTHLLLAEESGSYKPLHANEDYLWVIDPLDGTTNFAHHIPIFAVSISVSYQKETVSGVVYQPLTNELFVAEKGKGAFLNGIQVRVSETKKIEETLILAGMPDDNPDLLTKGLNNMKNISMEGATLRNFGSAALGLAYVASGKADASWTYHVYPWDFLAGKLMVEEAGGHVLQTGDKEHKLSGSSNILASNSNFYQTIKNYF